MCLWAQARNQIFHALSRKPNTPSQSSVLMLPCLLTKDCDILDCGSTEVCDRVMDKAGIVSGITYGDFGNNNFLCRFQDPPIEKPGNHCRRVRVCVAGEAEVSP